MKRIKNIALFFASPFIGLVYAVLLPFVGLYLLLNIAVEAALKKATSMILFISDCVEID